MLSCEECDKVYLGETGRQFIQRLREHKRGEGELTTNSLYVKHFIEEGHKFIDATKNFKIINIISDKRERKLREELEILRIRNENEQRSMNIKLQFENEELFRNLLMKKEG